MLLIFVIETLFLRKVAQEFSEILAWVQTCYLQLSELHFVSFRILSSCGVQQGGPLSPLLFSLALSSLQDDISIPEDLLLQVWYLDNGKNIGPCSSVSKFFMRLLCMVLNTVAILTHINVKSSGQMVIIRFTNSPRPSYALLRECVCWDRPCGAMNLFFRNQ